MTRYSIAILALLSRVACANPPPVGLWEQFYVSVPTSNSNSNRHRVDLIVANQPVTKGSVFSALSDSGTKMRILCCIQTQSDTRLTLRQLLNKYPFSNDDVEHLKTISGVTYIYEAEVVQGSAQNGNMRDLIDSLSDPADRSPYSSALIGGSLRSLEFAQKHFQLDGHDVTFGSRFDSQRDSTLYEFNVDSQRVKFSEGRFPD
jgi:hypothetical protein